MKSTITSCLLSILTLSQCLAQSAKAPIMGWSSWNCFRVNFNEQMIQEQADAMISSGMYEAGYRFINIDDGYFGGRTTQGELFENAKKFPSGMRKLVDYIHSKNLKAGIYTDGGANTCGGISNRYTLKGIGIFDHVEQDCQLFFKKWGFDFLKVDWCGGREQKLDAETQYSQIIAAVKAINQNIVLNVCNWKFPGEWVIQKADAWRISTDIHPKFSSVLQIIDQNADLYKYASPGHYNDMDMLQVGNGMSYEEDKTHFSMWCMLNSPLIAGNDLRKMNPQTLAILTNKELIALNQDINFVQARRIMQEGDIEVWVKPLGLKGEQKAIAILNRSTEEKVYALKAEKLGLHPKSKLRDLWQHQDIGVFESLKPFNLPAHGIVILKAD
jgi:alpha-galactosidase